MVCIRESTKSHLCSKLSLFKMSWCMLEMLLQLSPLVWYLPYLRAFQWGTVWTCTSRGIKNMTNQNWNIQNGLTKTELSTLTCHIFDTPGGTGSNSTSWRYRVKQYLIGKLLNMVTIRQEGSVVTALLAIIRMSLKMTVYYINGALLIL